MMADGDTMTPEQYQAWAHGEGNSTKNKYGARPTIDADGRWYASTNECRRASELRLLLKAEQIRSFAKQPEVWLVAAIRCVWDFVVVGLDGAIWYEDVKGCQTDVFKQHRCLWARHGHALLHVLTRKRGGWDREIIGGTTPGGGNG